MMPLRTCGETPPPRAHAFCGQGEDRRADDMSSNNMVKLVSNDGEIFELSELAAQQSITIVNMRDDTDDTPIKVEILGKADLKTITALLTRTAKILEELKVPDARRAELFAKGLPRGAALDDNLRAAMGAALDELGVVGVDAARLMGTHLKWFHAKLPATILAESMAQLLRGKSADELRALLGNDDDLSDDEKRAALAEPLFTAPSAEKPAAQAPPQPERTLSLALDDSDPFEGNIRTCLERCDARTLRELKAVSSAWRRRAREVLGDSKSEWRQQPIWSTSAKGMALARQLEEESSPARQLAMATSLARDRHFALLGLLHRMREELDREVELPGHAAAIVIMLKDWEIPPDDGGETQVRAWALIAVSKVRWTALTILRRLEPTVLAGHASAIVDMLEDSDASVRYNALETLAKLEAAVLGQHAAAIAQQLDPHLNNDMMEFEQTHHSFPPRLRPPVIDLRVGCEGPRYWSGAKVRLMALETLGKMDAATLAKHAAAIVAKFEDSMGEVRFSARLMMHKIEPAAGHLAAVLEGLQDPAFEQGGVLSYVFDDPIQGASVRMKALEALGSMLEPPALAPHAAAVVAMLESEVRSTAVETLGKLEPAALAGHADDIVAKLNHPDQYVRQAALRALAKLQPAALAQHAAAVVAKLEDPDRYRYVRREAMETLGKLQPAALAQHAAAVVARLEDCNGSVRIAAVQTLGKLEPATLAPHEAAIRDMLKDDDYAVRRAAEATLGKLQAAAARAE